MLGQDVDFYAGTTTHISDKLTVEELDQSDAISGINLVTPDNPYIGFPPPQPISHRWYYYAVVTVLFGILLAGAGFLTYGMYMSAIGWHNDAYAQGQHTGYALGMVDGYKSGYTHGLSDQTTQDGKLLAKVKTADAQVLQSAKLTSYNAGKADEIAAYKQWWAAHCAYDKTITVWVCDTSH